MLGAAAFSSAANAAAASVERIGTAGDTATTGSSKLGTAMSKAQGPLMAIGRGTAMLGGALAAAGGAAGLMGLKFNAGMEQSRVAFTNLLGSGEEAQAMLDRLYGIAAKTPFEFPQLTQSTQRLLGFGMAAKDVIPTMTAIGDAVAAAGGGAEQIDRVSTALGQIQAKGKVSTEELMQMAESGVPAMKILADQMGITGAELSSKLQAGAITADKGIAALVAGMNKRYKGAAAAQSKTFSGQLSTLKDLAAQQLGTIMLPLFNVLRDKAFPAISKALQSGGLQRFAAGVGPALTNAFRIARDAFTQFMDAIKPAMPFIQNIVWPILKGLGMGVLASVVGAFKVLIPIIKIVATVLGWIGRIAKPLAPWFERLGMVVGFVASGPILKLIGGLSKLGGVFKVIGVAAKVAAVPIKALGAIFGVVFKAAGKLFGILGNLAPKAASAARALLRPFQSLPSKFVEFGRSIVDAIIRGITASPGAILDAISGILPGGKAGEAIRSVIPGIQHGGIITRGGPAVVGEKGPELVDFERGARVIPLPSPTVTPIFVGGTYGSGEIRVPVYLDGRVITEVVAQRTADRRARR